MRYTGRMPNGNHYIVRKLDNAEPAVYSVEIVGTQGEPVAFTSGLTESEVFPNIVKHAG